MAFNSKVTTKDWLLITLKVNSTLSPTDRLGGVVPGDVVVKVGVVRHAPDLEFLPNNTYVFIHLQEDIWRETELWKEMNIDEFKKNNNNNNQKPGYSSE